MPRFSANLHFLFTERPFLDRFAAAAAAGFQAVEFPDPYAHSLPELCRRLRDHRLTCVLVNAPMGDRTKGERGLACLPDRVDEFRAGVARAIAVAEARACPRINCMAGRLPDSGPPRGRAGSHPVDAFAKPSGMEEARATLVDNLRFAAAACAVAGLEVCLEPLNPVDDPLFFLTGCAAAMEIIHAVAAPNLRLQFDCYHRQLAEGDVEGWLVRAAPLLGHVQVGDVPGRHEPGSGRIPYPRLFSLLDDVGYSGWVGAEYHPSRPTEETLSWMTAWHTRP